MSTTGRKPVIAAPTPIPVKPASEIGVSITRSAPNSSTRPDNTLNGVPASATSSPKMHTRESRRISSASASRTACANVSSLVATSGINVLVHLVDSRVRRGNRKLNGRLHFRTHFFLDLLQLSFIRKILDRVPLGLPFELFLFRTVIFAVDVPHVVSRVAIRFANQERRPSPLPRAIHQSLRRRVHRPHVLPIHAFCLRSKRSSPRENVPRRRLRKVRVFRVQIVFANVDHRQFPERRQVHHFIQNPLPQRPFAKKAHCHLSRAQPLRRKCRSRRNSRAPAYDRVRPQISRRRVRNMHGPAFATAVSRLFAQQLREHPVGRSSFRHAMAMPPVRARNVVVPAQRLANPHRNRFFANVKVRQPRHQRPGIKFVHLFFELPDHHHPPVHPHPLLGFHFRFGFGLIRCNCHGLTPDICAKTWNTTAKSFSSSPSPRAAVRNSFVTAVVGIGTSSCRPSSSARFMSFCIMLTLNHASSCFFKINGPRYCTIGEAITLCVSTSTAISRAIPLFSASSTPSENASICTARLRFVPIFITSARPLSPTYVTFGPMSCKSGFTFSKVSLRPPTITDNFPSCSVITLPETGESTMSPPFSRTLAATSRLYAGLTVLISTKILPGVTPASIPSGPFITAPSAAEFVTMENVTSAAATTARGESAHFIPFLTSHSAFERVRLLPVTLWPFPSSRFTISPPITPSPTNPRFAMYPYSPR